MTKPPSKWSFPRRSSYGVLERFIGQEINVFGPRSCEEHDNCLGGGFLLSIEDGFMLLSERQNEPPDLAVSLSEVVVIAVIKDRPELTAVDGGKVHRFRRPEPPQPLDSPEGGDGDDTLAFEIDRLHRSCRRLIWLNPLLRYEGFQPRARGVRTILRHVDELRPIHNLESMHDLIRALAQGSGDGDRKAMLRVA